MKQELMDKAKKSINTLNDILVNPDVYTRDIVAGKSLNINLDIQGSGTIY